MFSAATQDDVRHPQRVCHHVYHATHTMSSRDIKPRYMSQSNGCPWARMEAVAFLSLAKTTDPGSLMSPTRLYSLVSWWRLPPKGCVWWRRPYPHQRI